ncbi:hypothetical protein AD933_08680 [Acetobacter malorum]|uniref:Uncharacterized protein n=1 Tax=Acetobacter malorum TaxID=178901 RepID=A0A149RML4_9PROT|nr:hypothetical protein [Acetobacter malorum]KXV15436.1 hypothetical protein AD933_08680 [Acetobacter malorum]
MIYVKLFFAFYCSALVRGGYAVQQLFESLGYQILSNPISFDIFSLPDLNFIEGIVLLWGVVDFVLYCFVAFSQNRAVRIFLLLLLILPGILSAFFFPLMIRPAPLEIWKGESGSVGDVTGYSVLAVLMLVLGWSSSLLITRAFKYSSRCFDLFEHIWILVGLSAGLFFVSETMASRKVSEYTITLRTVQQSSGWLMRQLGAYSAWCAAHPREADQSCQWADRIHGTLLAFSYEDLENFADFSPESLAHYYGRYRHEATQQEEDLIRSEIARYNEQMCPVKELGPDVRQYTSSHVCEVAPADFCLFGFRYGDEKALDNVGRSFAVSTECVLPKLLSLRDKAPGIIKGKNAAERGRASKVLFFYMVLAFLAGIKMAGSSIKLFKPSSSKHSLSPEVPEKRGANEAS